MKPTPCARRRAIAAASKPQSASAARPSAPRSGAGPRTAPGVREKRGAGAGCSTPPTRRCAPARHRVRMRAPPRPTSAPARRRHRSASNTRTHSSRVLRREHRGEALRAARASARDRSAPAAALRRGRGAGAARRRTGARWRRRRRTGRRACAYVSYHGAPESSTFSPRASLHRRAACRPQNIVVSSDAPSTIAASTTWPRPGALRLDAARRRCRTRAACRRRRSRRRGSAAAPARSPARPIACSAPASAM